MPSAKRQAPSAKRQAPKHPVEMTKTRAFGVPILVKEVKSLGGSHHWVRLGPQGQDSGQKLTSALEIFEVRSRFGPDRPDS